MESKLGGLKEKVGVGDSAVLLCFQEKEGCADCVERRGGIGGVNGFHLPV